MARTTKPALTAKTADIHTLYQEACQVPEADVRFLDRSFVQEYGRHPLTLREDFCGTALLCAEWVKSRGGRVAHGVDLDARVLAWGRRHNIRPLGAGASRVHLHRGDVLHPRRPAVDVQVAFNFSWWVFHAREDLLRYFRAARASIAREGLFVIDIHGGWESFKDLQERRGYRRFRYVWDQASFNPIDHRIRCHIHFEFPDGSRIRKAFTYDWRWWSMMETRDALIDAGFRRTDVYWEGTVAGTERGNGVFRKAAQGDNDASWITYIVAVP